MAKLQYLVIHCTDTPPEMLVDKAVLTVWHTSPKPTGRGWDRLGYSDIIRRSGEVQNLTPYNDDDIVDSNEITWGASGVNSISRHIVLEGGWKNKKEKAGTYLPEEIFTLEQLDSLKNYITTLLAKFTHVKVIGHRDTAKARGKTCPNFDVHKFLKSIL